MIFGLFKNYEPKTTKEKNVYEIINKLCLNEKTVVKISNGLFLMNLQELHYSVIISGNIVLIVNSEFTLREAFETRFVNALVKMIYKRATKDINEIISNIETREDNMLSKAIIKIDESMSEDQEKEKGESSEENLNINAISQFIGGMM